MGLFVALIPLFALFCHSYAAPPKAELHLVTMTKQELYDIVKCVVDSKDTAIRKRFEQCEDKMAQEVKSGLAKCRKEVIGDDTTVYYETLTKEPKKIMSIFDCITEKTHKLSAREKREMMSFEDCSRKVYEEKCAVRGL